MWLGGLSALVILETIRVGTSSLMGSMVLGQFLVKS